MRAAPLNRNMAEAGWQKLARFTNPALIGEFLARAWQAGRERRALAELDPRLLLDMGIDPAEARREASRSFWELPEHHEAKLRRKLVY